MISPASDTVPLTLKLHRNNFNFLRIVFAFLVILSHSSELIDGDRHREILTRLFHTLSFGGFAVNGFFILSGYLIVKSWLSNPIPVEYLKKRILRIVPGFVVASLLSVLIVGALGADDRNLYFAHINWVQVGTHLLTLNGIPKHPGIFQGLPYPVVNGSLWTIQYEFGCYLLVIALGVTSVFRFRPVFGFFFLFSIGGYLLAHHLEPLLHPLGLFGLPIEWARLISFFLVGGCFYIYRDKIVYRARWAGIAFLALLLVLRFHQAQIVALPLLQAYLLFFIGFYPAPRLAKIGTKTDISYGLYLYAWPVQMLLLWNFRRIDPWTLCAASFIITSGLAWLSWTLIEKPALALKPRRAISPAPISAGGGGD